MSSFIANKTRLKSAKVFKKEDFNFVIWRISDIERTDRCACYDNRVVVSTDQVI